MANTITYEEELLTIKHGVWITPLLAGDYCFNRVSVNKFTGRTFLVGNLNWLIKEFTKNES